MNILARLVLCVTLLTLVITISTFSAVDAKKKHSKVRKFRAAKYRADAAKINGAGYNCGGTAVTESDINSKCSNPHKLNPGWVANMFQEANGGAIDGTTVQCGPQGGHLDVCELSNVLRSVWCDKGGKYDFRGMFYHPPSVNIYRRCTAN